MESFVNLILWICLIKLQVLKVLKNKNNFYFLSEKLSRERSNLNFKFLEEKNQDEASFLTYVPTYLLTFSENKIILFKFSLPRFGEKSNRRPSWSREKITICLSRSSVKIVVNKSSLKKSKTLFPLYWPSSSDGSTIFCYRIYKTNTFGDHLAWLLLSP